MFGHKDPEDTAQGDLIARARRAAWRARVLGALAATLAVLLIGGGAFVSAQWSAAVSDTCDTWAPVDISIEDLITLKRRKNAWQASMEDDAALVMSDREVNFILRGTTPYELLATFEGDHIRARLTVPLDGGGCLNVTFAGKAHVARRVVTFVPEQLLVGEVDLTPVLGGRSIDLTADQAEGWVDPGVLDALRNAEKVEVKDSAVHIELYDRRKVW